MSQQKEIICPNCNSKAYGNYCHQCGQATHLHKDTFAGLISHFASHYFHFESKFWVTLKTLVFRPGRLTKAYHEKQRMRYIQPISLYIFTSVAFFIIFSFTFRFEQRTEMPDGETFLIHHSYSLGLYGAIKTDKHEKKWITDYNCDSLREVVKGYKSLEEERKSYFKQPYHKFEFTYPYLFATFYNYYIYPYAYRHYMYDIDTPVTIIYNKFFSLLPKIFFLLMPLLALLLYAAFFNSKKYKFVDYAVLSLHTHIFMFVSIAFLLLVVGSVTDASTGFWIISFCIVVPLLHFILACRNFFQRSWVYTTIATTIVWALYLAIVVLLSVVILLSLISYS